MGFWPGSSGEGADFSGAVRLAAGCRRSVAGARASWPRWYTPDFVRTTPAEWLREYPRYLKAIDQRLDKVGSQLQRERVCSSELATLREQYQTRAVRHAREDRCDPSLVVYRGMLEESRISLFALQPGTRQPVPDKRLSKQGTEVPD